MIIRTHKVLVGTVIKLILSRIKHGVQHAPSTLMRRVDHAYYRTPLNVALTHDRPFHRYPIGVDHKTNNLH